MKKVAAVWLSFTFFFSFVVIIDIAYDILPYACAGTPKNGTIGSETWSLSGSPYWIEGNLTVSDGATLTINPGVDIFFNGSYVLFVNGTLNALGTPSNMIRFTSNKTDPAPGDWEGIITNFMGTGHVTIEHCNITYGYIAIAIWNSSHNIINNDIFMNEGIGILVAGGSNNNISNNNVYKNNSTGISLFISNNNTIYNNNISHNAVGGIGVIGGLNNTISHNEVSFNEFGGIDIYSSSNTNITYNEIFSNTLQGIFLHNSSYTNILNNNISDNPVGIKSWSSSNNWIHHNNIVDNSDQAIDDGSTNYWDDGLMGNYWNDYNGVDADEDGIGDTPYIIDEDSQDNYPLIYAYPDTSPPIIELESPDDNSMIKAGTIIDLSVSDKNLKEVEYSVNDGSYSQLDSPYDINTNSWVDGDYSINVRASDTSGKESSKEYNFIIDSTKPTIILNSPSNNDYIPAGTDIDLIVSDENLNTLEYSVNGGTTKNLNHPYDISTDGWEDDIYSVQIYVNDIAGNENTRTYSFTLDSTYPMITLTAPTNDSLILAGTLIELDISDTNLDEVTCSIDDGAYQAFNPPYNIDTYGREDGEHTVGILAQDLAGNRKSRSYVFTTDGTSPEIAEHHPERYSVDVQINTSITITFSEPMDTSSVESALMVSPDTEYTLSWEDNDSVLRITFNEPLEYNTYYEASVGTQAKDLIGQNLENKVTISFTTQEKPKKGDDEFPLMFILLAVIITIVVAVIIVFLVTSKKKQKPSPQMVVTSPGPPMPPPIAPPVQPAMVLAPQMLQVRCSQCQNILQVKDLGVAMKITCPFCSTALTVQSQKTATTAQQPQAQKQNLPTIQQVSCPKCKTSFPVVKSEGPKNIQCPSCGLTGRYG